MSDTSAVRLDDTLRGRILDAVAEGFDKQIEFTRELVRLPSLRGREHTAQDFLHRALAERGYAMDRWTIDVAEIEHHPGFSPVEVSYDNAVNLVASHRPRREQGRSLILNGHIDVVPTGPWDMWSTPPFEPRIEGDWLYGRGAGDMKAGLAANVHALDALRRLGLQPAATVYLQSVVEEECTGNGALACLVRGYRADAALIPEPVQEQLTRANVGVLWLRITLRGHPVHALEAHTGSNAIEAAFDLIRSLKQLEADWNARRGEHPHFEHMEHPINFNVGRIEGGDWASSVPAWCRFELRVGFYPGIAAADARREVENHLRSASRGHPFLANNPPDIENIGFHAEGYVLEPGGAAEQTLVRAHQHACRENLASETFPAYLDGRVFMLYDDCPALVYGPHARAIHGFDERVSLASVRRVTGTIALFIADWCGLEPV
jgi:acetylornithine deacetylase